MAQIKQELKFYRIPSNTVPATTPSGGYISGYYNHYSEFKQWDNYANSIFGINIGKSYQGPAPVDFFVGGDENAALEIRGIPYKDLTFVIDRVSEPYDRTKMNLSDLASSIYVVDYSTKEPTALDLDTQDLGNARLPLLAPNKDDAVKNLQTVSFYINPQNIHIQQKKLWQKLRTRGGWALQHWGPDIGTITIKATTGNIRPPLSGFNPKLPISKLIKGLVAKNQTVDFPTVQNSPAFAALRNMEKWYKEDQDELRIYRKEVSALEYRGQLYVGHLTQFTIDEMADNPFQLFYQIEFAIHYDASDLTAAMNHAAETYLRNRETLSYMQRLKESTSVVSSTSTSTSTSTTPSDQPSFQEVGG